MTSAELMKLLKAKFCPPHFATFTEVSNATGSGASRWADAVAMGIWPSRGLLLHGFELKVSRSDWVRERDNPAKAESVFRYCDRWSLVVGDLDIVKNGELPEPWGLLAPKDGKLVQIKPPPALEPEPVNRRFLAALLRRAAEQTADKAAIEAARAEGFAAGEKNANWRAVQDANHLAELLAELQKNCRDFEEASGVTINSHTWNAGKVGQMVRLMMTRDPSDQIRSLAEHAERVSKSCLDALAEFESARPNVTGK